MSKNRWLALALVAICLAGASLPLQPPASAASAALPQQDSSGEARSLTYAQDSTGQGWAIWEVDTGADVELYFSRQVGGEWSTPQPVHSRPQAWDRAPSLAVALDGVPWLAWSTADRDNPDQSRLVVAHWAGQHWSKEQEVPLGTSSHPRAPALAAGPDGTLWLAWVGFDGVDDEIFASRWLGGTWSSPWQVSADDADPALYDCQPQLAVGQDGQPWLVWTGHQSGVDDEIYASRWTGTGWSPEQMVSLDDEALDVEPSLVLDAKGKPWVAWKSRVADGEHSRRRILVSRWDATRSAWTPEELASSPMSWQVDEGHAALALGPDGKISLTWEATNGISSALAFVHGDADGWTKPRLLRTTALADPVAWAVSAAQGPTLLWLDSSLGMLATPQSLSPDDTAGLLETWIGAQPAAYPALVELILNRYLAFGDSITWGQYDGFTPYSVLLEATLDAKVQPSEVINSGKPSERTGAGVFRIGPEIVNYQPQFVMIMEGTNDVHNDVPPSDVQEHLMVMVDIAKRSLAGVRVMIASLPPRLDEYYRDTQYMNEMAVAPAAAGKNVPLCDQWQAFHVYGDWGELFFDYVHPNQAGLQLLADTFYVCLMASYPWLNEDVTPPEATLDPISSPVECGTEIPLTWSGVDPVPGTGVASFDVQVQVDGAGWFDWLVATTQTEATYPDPDYGHLYGFRVRARDHAGNVGEYSSPRSVQVVDNQPPDSVYVHDLPAAQRAPFTVHWFAHDACSGAAIYDVQVLAGQAGTWTPWLTATPNTSALYDPDVPQYAEPYSFRVRARDHIGNWSAWSEPASTLLARFVVRGHILTVRHEPIALASVTATESLAVEFEPLGGFEAYFAEPGDYDLVASRNGFGSLPPMHILSLSADRSGLELILPPADDVVADGDFETGSLDLWQRGGTPIPTLSAEPHTGVGAAVLGGAGGSSWLRQSLSVPAGLTDATLSFLVRLDEAGAGASAIQIALEGTSISHTHPVTSADWTHVWLPVDAAAGQPVTLTLLVDGTSAVRVDEVRLGSARFGGMALSLPLVLRDMGP